MDPQARRGQSFRMFGLFRGVHVREDVMVLARLVVFVDDGM